MLFVIRFTDKPDSRQVRDAFATAHGDWLAQNRSWIRFAGSLRVDRDTPPVGGLWLVDVATKEEAAEKLKTDPYWTCGLRRSVEILFWKLAFPDMQVCSYDSGQSSNGGVNV